ncbi:hypothetical protein DV735_g5402, partial [Chaetothyriales sp. CBS 134920]
MIFEMVSDSASPTSASDITTFLLICRPLYNRVAPAFWQKQTLTFSDPVALGNEFLAIASTTARSNLQRLHYMVPVSKFTQVKKNSSLVDTRRSVLLFCRDVAKFAEALALFCPGLVGLQALRIELYVDYWLSHLIFEHFGDEEDNAQLSASQYWGGVDSICSGCFGKLESTVHRCFLANGAATTNFHITACVETEQVSAVATTSLWGSQIQSRTLVRKLILEFGRN